MYNCHLDTQPGDLGPFKGCYSLTSTHATLLWGGALRDDTENSCEGD